MKDFIPYTYHLFHIPTKKHYYGVQHGRNAHPSNLWNKYFSSSKRVWKLIEEYGIDSFVFEIRKTFKTSKEAFQWEQMVLKKLNISKKSEWINSSLAHGPFYHIGPHSEETKQKMRKPKSEEHRKNLSKYHADVSGPKHPRWGTKNPKFSELLKLHGAEWNSKRIDTGKGRKHSSEHIKKCSETRKSRRGKYPKRTLKEVQCPHCNLIGRGGNMTRYHFDRCNLISIQSLVKPNTT